MEESQHFSTRCKDFLFKNLREIFGVVGFFWFKYSGEVPIFISLLISIIITIPIAINEKAKIGQVFLMYFSISLTLACTVFIEISVYEKLFQIFIIYDIINSMFKKSVYSVMLFFVEIWFLFSKEWSKFSLLMFSFLFISTCTFRVAIERDTENPITASYAFFISFVTSYFGEKVSIPIFIVSLIASLPRHGLPCPPQKLTVENWKSLFYIVLSVSSNGYILLYSTSHGALTLASDALTSICSNISIIGAVVTDVASRMLGTKHYTYGFSASLAICDLGSALLEVIAATQVIEESIEKFIDKGDKDVEGDKNLIILSIVSLGVNIFGAFFLESCDLNNNQDEKVDCSLDGGALTIICELISSSAVVFSSFLISVFNMTFIDPYVSTMIGVLIWIVTIPSIKNSLKILSLKSEFQPDYDKLAAQTNSEITGCAFSLGNGKSSMTVRVKGSRIRLYKIIRKYAKKHNVGFLTVENV